MWIPAQTTVPPFARTASAAGTSSPAGAKTIAASSSSGGRSSLPPAHSAPRLRANACVGVVAGLREREHAAALVAGDLRDDVRRRAEPVQPEPLGVSGEPERPVADQPGAEERGGLDVAVAVGDRQAEALVGDRQLGVAAVEVVAGEAGAVAEVLTAAQAVAARPVRPAEPGHAEPAAVLGDADDLVAEDERQLGVGQLPVERRGGRSGTRRRRGRGAAPGPGPAPGRAAPPRAGASRARRAPSPSCPLRQRRRSRAPRALPAPEPAKPGACWLRSMPTRGGRLRRAYGSRPDLPDVV